jgi:subtilisin
MTQADARWVLVKFAARPGGYGRGEAPAAGGGAFSTITWYDVATADEFGVNGSGLPTTHDGRIGFELRIGDQAVLTTTMTDSETEAIRRLPVVELVEDAPLVRALGAADTGSDTLIPSLLTIGISSAGPRARWGQGVRIAVLDTGVDSSHPDLTGIRGWTFVPNTTTDDCFKHGTYCAGVLAARENGVGLKGAAPLATVFNLKVLGDDGEGWAGWLMAAVWWCVVQDVQVANLSIGFDDASAIMRWVFEIAASRIVLVAAAGNRGQDDGLVLAPARFSGVLAVSALNEKNARLPSSSYGDEIDLAAPGEYIVTTEVCGGTNEDFHGTSAACPHVAGTAALVVSRFPGATPEWVRHLLKRTARPLRNGTAKDFGAGRVDADHATRSLRQVE